jgi:hypothetical protein
VSFGALLSPSVRNSRTAMMTLAGLTLAMRLAENAWFVLSRVSRGKCGVVSREGPERERAGE